MDADTTQRHNIIRNYPCPSAFICGEKVFLGLQASTRFSLFHRPSVAVVFRPSWFSYELCELTALRYELTSAPTHQICAPFLKVP
jgi:hypothetical protein